MDANGKMKTIHFSSGGCRLRGILHLPEAPFHRIVIGCHGLRGAADSTKQTVLAEACRRAGIAFFRFDHRGCGMSEGRFEEGMSLASRCTDLHAAYATLRQKGLPMAHLGLFGNSMGGAVCLATAGELNAKAVVTAAAPVSSDAVPAESIQREVPHFDFSLESFFFDLRDRLPAIHSILIFHGDADEVVPAANAHTIMQSSGEPKRLILLKGGDHRMTAPEHQRLFIRESVDWFRKMPGEC